MSGRFRMSSVITKNQINRGESVYIEAFDSDHNE